MERPIVERSPLSDSPDKLYNIPKPWDFEVMAWAVVGCVVTVAVSVSLIALALAIKMVRWAVE